MHYFKNVRGLQNLFYKMFNFFHNCNAFNVTELDKELKTQKYAMCYACILPDTQYVL